VPSETLPEPVQHRLLVQKLQCSQDIAAFQKPLPSEEYRQLLLIGRQPRLRWFHLPPVFKKQQ
jgi:hypothetical protein